MRKNACLHQTTHLRILQLDMELVVHEVFEALVVFLVVLLVLLRFDGIDSGLIGEVALDRDVSGVENNVLARLGGHVFGDNDDGL